MPGRLPLGVRLPAGRRARRRDGRRRGGRRRDGTRPGGWRRGGRRAPGGRTRDRGRRRRRRYWWRWWWWPPVALLVAGGDAEQEQLGVHARRRAVPQPGRGAVGQVHRQRGAGPRTELEHADEERPD